MNYIKEAITKESEIIPIHKSLNFIKGSLSVCRLLLDNNLGTGFFIKFKNETINRKYQFFLMTCSHIINNKIINLNNIVLNIYYHYNSIHKQIILNKNERFIKDYSDYKVDITIIEIKPEDNISWVYFLEPDYNIINGFDQYENSTIIIHQYPLGNEQCYSKGKVINIINEEKLLQYTSSTEKGSSGSPIIKVGSTLVFGVHNGGEYNNDYYGNNNQGNFIIDVLNDNERINNQEIYHEEEYYNFINLIKMKRLDNNKL